MVWTDHNNFAPLWTQDRHNGCSSWGASTSPSPIDLVCGMRSLMPCPTIFLPIPPVQILAWFCLPPALWVQQVADSGPAETPHNCSVIRSFWCPSVGNSSKLTCLPGLAQTSSFLQQRFWWPSRWEDTRSFVAACPVCACIKSLNSSPAGLLGPLPIPRHPWSHVGVDFVTGLPPGKTILTVVDCFSKAHDHST